MWGAAQGPRDSGWSPCGPLAILSGSEVRAVRRLGPREWRGTAYDRGFQAGSSFEEPRPRTSIVPKMKSKGAVKKRFRTTKSGKLKCSKPKRGHQHAPKDAKTKRNKRKAIVVSGTWAYLLKRMMGGG